MARPRVAKEKICDAVVGLLAEKSLEDITVSEVVARAQINRSTYYYYFYEVKDVVIYLIDELICDFSRLFDRAVGGDDHDVPWNQGRDISIAELLMHLIYDNRSLINILLDSGFKAQFEERFIDASEGKMRNCVIEVTDASGASHVLGSGPTYDMHTRQMAYTFWAAITFWHKEGFRMTPEEMNELLIEVASGTFTDCRPRRSR